MRLMGALLVLLSSQPRASGVVEGTVRLAEGIELEPTYIANTTDPQICGEGRTLDDVLVSPSRGLANVIVVVREAPSAAAKPEKLVLDNVQCRFAPHAAAVTLGSTVEARNSDTVLHTTHFYGPKEMNISLPLEGVKSARVLDRPGLYVVKCDIHGWMQAFIRVDPHPFHAVTDAEGRFRIEGLPPGEYTLELWHERLGSLQHDVKTPSSPIEIEYAP